MKQIFIFLIGVVFLAIAGCNRISGNSSSKSSSVGQVDTLKLNFEEETNEAKPVMTNVEVIEPIVTIGSQKTVAVEKPSEVPKNETVSAIPRTLPSSGAQSIPKEKTLSVKTSAPVVKDQAIRVEPRKKVVSSVSVHRKGSYIRVGKDISGQVTSPRLPIQVTAVAFNESKWGRYVDFRLYAIPTRSKFTKSSRNLISSYNNIVLVNGQAQLTKFWNGKNIYGHFLGKGKYNIYLFYRIKNRTKKIIYAKGRYWGNSRSYYLKLY